MSAEAMVWAWAQDLEPLPQLVLLALAEDAHGYKAECWPTKAVLTKRTGMTETQLAEALTVLKGLGLIYAQEVTGGAHKYFLSLNTMSQRQAKPARAIVPAGPIPPDLQQQMTRAFELWNEMAERTKNGPKEHRLSKVKVLSEALKKHLKARLDEGGFQLLADNILAIERNAHCRGVNDRGWRADFSYLVSPSGFTNTSNGRWAPDYEERSRGGTRTGPGGRGDQRLDNLRGFDTAVRGGLAQGRGRDDRGEDHRRQSEAPGRGAGQALIDFEAGGSD